MFPVGQAGATTGETVPRYTSRPMPRRPSRHRRPLFVLLPGLLALGMVIPPAAGAAPHSSGRGGPSSILVRFRPSAPPSDLQADVRRAGGTRLGTVYGLPVTVVEVPPGRSARGLAAR